MCNTSPVMGRKCFFWKSNSETDTREAYWSSIDNFKNTQLRNALWKRTSGNLGSSLRLNSLWCYSLNHFSSRIFKWFSRTFRWNTLGNQNLAHSKKHVCFARARKSFDMSNYRTQSEMHFEPYSRRVISGEANHISGANYRYYSSRLP